MLIRKLAYNGGTLQTQTDYLDGFIYLNGTLSFFNMPEGRVINNSGTFTQEFIITDDQGNARVSFQNNGSGVAAVKQENSYYGFGLQLPHSPVGMSTPQNRFMYNGGNSEWQNDYSNLPDYYQTFNRNYDQAIGRFVGIDQEPESAESMTGYQYAGNNPIMMNDPDGAKATPAAIWQLMQNSMAAEAACQSMGGNMHLAGIGWEDGPAFGGPMPALNTGSDGTGLINSDPTAYWNYYEATDGTMGGTTLYRAPNSDTGPAIGNLNSAINATPAVLAAYANGASGVEVAYWNNGTTEVIPTKNGVSYVNVQGQYDGAWYTVWNSRGLTGLAGGDGSSQDGGQHPLNIPNAITALDDNALSSSSGYCAKYVRWALEAGGINTNGHPVAAKDYGPFLKNVGFDTVNSYNYSPQAGDIVVFSGFGSHTYGHIEMYDGTQWVSDFLQSGFWPGSSYSNPPDSYTIYRYHYFTFNFMGFLNNSN